MESAVLCRFHGKCSPHGELGVIVGGMGLTTIDVSAFATGHEPGATGDEIAALLDETCRETGFFLVTGHGIDPEITARMFAATEEFFALPVADKDRIAIGKSPCHRGYVGIGAEALDGVGDMKESLDTGCEHPADHPEVLAGTPLYGPNQFPDLSGFRAAWEAYFAAAREACERVQRAMARALGRPDDFFLTMGEIQYHLRMLHYPPRRETGTGPERLGCGAHTDFGTMTLLADDGIGGLQVMTRSGDWIDVVAPPGHLVANFGDLMSIWTNDRWVSNPHRVINPPERHRYSVPMFVAPQFHTEISNLIDGEEAKYPPQGAGDYLVSRIDDTHTYRNPLLAG
ncbi:isopenicillin N synthase family oxygenase [Pseudonocardiaceae bacterium YIM PH 21723]|nr:isopenicillin N synthase family oxygenase [Pseudonocardiaceae bacterium YIM PH 21723]